jgi:hypothetical protein
VALTMALRSCGFVESPQDRAVAVLSGCRAGHSSDFFDFMLWAGSLKSYNAGLKGQPSEE